MKKVIKASKWYWYIPIVWFFYIREMSHWTFEPDTFIERAQRGIFVQYLIFPNVFVILLLLHIFNLI